MQTASPHPDSSTADTAQVGSFLQDFPTDDRQMVVLSRPSVCAAPMREIVLATLADLGSRKVTIVAQNALHGALAAPAIETVAPASLKGHDLTDDGVVIVDTDLIYPEMLPAVHAAIKDAVSKVIVLADPPAAQSADGALFATRPAKTVSLADTPAQFDMNDDPDDPYGAL